MRVNSHLIRGMAKEKHFIMALMIYFMKVILVMENLMVMELQITK